MFKSLPPGLTVKIIGKLSDWFYIFPVTSYIFKSVNVLRYMPHIKKHPDYMKTRTRRTKLKKGDYEDGVDRVRKIVDTGKKEKK